MSAGAGFFLFLLPLAGLPVLFHLLMRRRRKKLVFSTLMFFHRVDPRLSTRRRLRELLLLASRVLLILLVLLTLARLSLHSSLSLLGLQGKQAVVVIVDNSASMGAKAADSEQPKLRLALDTARALLGHLDSSAEAGIVLLVPDPYSGFEDAGMSGDVEAIVKDLERLQVSEATGSPGRALARAAGLLRSASTSGGGAIHVITDLQGAEWADQAIGESPFGDNVQVVFHRIPSATFADNNVAVVQAEMVARRILPRQPYKLQVALRNDGKDKAVVRLNSEDDQRKNLTEVVEIPAEQTKTLSLMVKPEAPGYHWVKVWVEGDAFAGDNHATVGYLCEDKAAVLFAGTQAEYSVLPLAISPFGDGRFTSLVPDYCPPEELLSRLEKQKPALVVLTWDQLATVAAGKTLADFVEQGGNLAIVPTATGSPRAIAGPAWLGASIEPMQTSDTDVTLSIIDRNAAFWSPFQDRDGRLQLGRVRARQFCILKWNNEAKFTPLLGVGVDKSVLAATRLGKGQVVISGIAFDPQWNNFPRLKSMVVLGQTMALGGRAQEAFGLSAVAGQALQLPGKGAEVQIVSLVGDPLDWSGVRGNLPILPRSGAYSVRVGNESYTLSLRSSDREGEDRFVEETRVPALGNVPHTIRTLDQGDLQEALTASRTGLPLYLPLLMLGMAALVAESLLGAPPLRSKSSQEEQT